MSALTSRDFTDFYREAWGRDPFPWQRRLAEQVCDAPPADGLAQAWPRCVSLPTASGKTALLDVAVFALACQASRAVRDRTTPRRIAFVVDRRVIVDEAFERAESIADELEKADCGPFIRRVADALRSLAGPHARRPLECHQLRGGVYRDDAWARRPLQPTILCSTVDQVGSRLLFRGYGSGRSAPIHAGLLAFDTLIVLDEAHCSEPFRQTLEAVRRYRSWGSRAGDVPGPFASVVMSATPPPGYEVPFRLGDDDLAQPTLAARLLNPKPARLRVVKDANAPAKPQGRKETPRQRDERQAKQRQAALAFARALVEEAKKMTSGAARAVGVLVNRVQTARDVAALLREPDVDGKESADVVLLTGRMRPLDARRVLKHVEVLKTGVRADHQGWTPKSDLPRPLFVVATQTLEVGADLDFDALVTECASLDALRQRFGRLNRGGGKPDVQAAILIRQDQTKSGYDDPVYGTSLTATWEFLESRLAAPAGKERARRDEATIDFAAKSFEASLDQAAGSSEEARRELLDRLNAPRPDAPVLLPAHLDALVQTDPEPTPQPDVGLFLHGPNRDVAEVQVCWRSDVDAATGEERWRSILSFSPPRSGECVAVPLHALKSLDDEFGSDVLSERGDGGTDDRRPLALFRWRGPQDPESRLLDSADDVRPGDTVVLAGTDVETLRRLVDLPRDGVVDLGFEAAATHVGERLLASVPLRLHLALIEQNFGWLPSDDRSRLQELAASPSFDVETRRELLAGLGRAARARRDAGLFPSHDLQQAWLDELTRRTHVERWTVENVYGLTADGAARGWLIQCARGGQATSDGDDASLAAEKPVTLDAHSAEVATHAALLAERCGLHAMTEEILWSGWLHDAGKADPRFQRWLAGDRRRDTAAHLLDFLAPEPLAKSGSLRLTGSCGFRHELVSALVLHRISERGALGVADVDLVQHLIATHHGRCRPFAPLSDPGNPRDEAIDLRLPAPLADFANAPIVAGVASEKRLEDAGSGVAECFWRAVRKYGWWGSAYLEAVFRLADHQVSAGEVPTPSVPRLPSSPLAAAPAAPVAPAARVELPLDGLEAGNPLAYLAALGVLRALADAWPERRVRLHWRSQAGWRPVVSVEGAATADELSAALHASLAKLNGHPALGLDAKNLNVAPDVYRRFLERAVEATCSDPTHDRTWCDFAAGFACDVPHDEATVFDTAFRTMSGTGHQHFLETIRGLAKECGLEHLRKTLFHEWLYDDPLRNMSLRWDPRDRKQYAFQWINPEKDSSRGAAGSMLGANRLAVEALRLLPTTPVAWGVATTGVRGKNARDTHFTWPIWRTPLDVETARALVALAGLQLRKPDRESLRRMGVVDVFRSRRLTVDRYDRRNFAPAAPA